MAAPKRPRARRRDAERTAAKLGDAREELARLSPGGSPEQPLEVDSASIVESRAGSLACARCEGEVRVEDHEAITTPSGRLRRVRTRCRVCGALREVWVHVAAPLLQ